MGYYVSLTTAWFGIPETPEVLATLHALNERDDLKRGGSWGGTEGEKSWFSWMPADLTELESVEEFFGGPGLGFAVLVEDGRVWLQGYDNKTGQEDIFLAVVAKFVPSGHFIEWRGEDGEMWRNEVENGRLVTREAIIQWGPPEPVNSFTRLALEDSVWTSVVVPIFKD